MEVSIIIINYNTTALTRQCLQSVIERTKYNRYELIVIDNASSDRSIENLETEFEQATFIFNAQNEGFGRANNQGIAIAKGKYVFLLNSDTWLLNDAVYSLWQFMENKERMDVGCCGGDLFHPDGHRQVAYGNFPSLAEAFSVLGFFHLYKHYFSQHISSGVINEDNKVKQVGYISGADMFIRKSVLEQTGAFDPDFFLYFEETELCYRMSKQGFTSYLVPEARIIHLEGASQAVVNRFNLNKIKLFTKSRSLYFSKCYGNFSMQLMNCLYYLQAILQFIFSFGDRGYLKIAKIIRTQHRL